MASPTCPHFCSLLLLHVLLPLLPPVFTYSEVDCQPLKSLVLKQNKPPEPWLSPSREFALGFHPVDGSPNFLLAVWFYKIKDDQTIVWSANGNKPAPPSSEFKLTNDGEFVLVDPDGGQLWKAQTNGSKSTCAAMLDNGNFVILDENYSPIWESFKEPTDTILPGQILGMPSILQSRKSETDYADGCYQLSLQEDGNLVLYLISLTTIKVVSTYWATGRTMNWKSQLVFDEAGRIYIKDGNTSTTYNLTSDDQGSNQLYYFLARVDHDGVFTLYKHPKNENKASNGSCRLSWTLVQEIPDDSCMLTANNANSIGWCGYNSICEKIGRRPAGCRCPDRYSFLNPSEPWKGCKPDFPLPSCQTDGWEADKEQVDFIEFPYVDWPLSDYDLKDGHGVDKAACQKLCLDDCFCSAAIYEEKGGLCWSKKFPMSNGRSGLNITNIVLLKVPKGNVTNVTNKKEKSTLVLVLAVLLGSSTFLNILLLIAISAALFYLYHKKLNSASIASTSATNMRSYTYEELEKATGGFKQTLGRGAFGTVYKGVVASDPRRFVAVKKLEKVVGEGEKEFKTEVSVICQTHHKNLVRLLGYCDEGEHRLLVYEYMSNGSLASFLFGISRPHWNQRVQIAFGIARGLMYLHEECRTQIIHCDIKPQNILLDEYFTPRISDFGLAKLLLAEQSKAHTQRRGTVGYFAPEWFSKASISVKVDVYSFGVMLLEIICCKSSVSFAMGDEEEASIDWAYECYIEKRLEKLVENDEEARNDMKSLERLVIVAIWCIQEDPSLRPTMKKVTQMLEGVVDVYVPPRPSLYTSPPPIIS
ncbi:G-type lectin S-receptor-like serine/threonine-protein kinase LECRK3 [Alnus glutinosa]|uniref:G-type lectin S-receptor-like serine/threonine-protein kinase LECRK3 n=1 Tax=Alnus glutinosa TaxID=3517 RepID=UPI002D77E121|nr:G-type lectin S-receptor-like serine/threonine-protein kinase LECRK3 [Alnus glutinosa]